ncbi:hypothetical protein PR048_032054 [Dryococelus australis]|uniref:Uncharacterized protein n=1 Tax=Dryococelus australis TaxID=614101 RepID=A0ABQ9G156_9NEOP|nr:hypothetical protein PR048_032054 [Dryococelus australis]
MQCRVHWNDKAISSSNVVPLVRWKHCTRVYNFVRERDIALHGKPASSVALHLFGQQWITPVESEEGLLARIMAAADLGRPRIGDRVYQNMVHRYRVCVRRRWSSHRALLTWERSTCDVVVFCLSRGNGTVATLLALHPGEPSSITRGGRSRILVDLPFPPPLHFGAAPNSLHFTLIGSQDLLVKSLLYHSSHIGRNWSAACSGRGWEALRCYQEALSLSPTHRMSLLGAARILRTKGQWPRIHQLMIRDLPFSSPVYSSAASYSRYFIIDSQDLDDKSRPNPFTHSPGRVNDSGAIVRVFWSSPSSARLEERRTFWASEVSMEQRWNARAGGNGRSLRKSHIPAASSGTIPTSKNPGVTPPGIEPGSPCRKTPAWPELSSAIAAEKCGIDKGDTATLIKCAIAVTRRNLNCVYVWDFGRWLCYFIMHSKLAHNAMMKVMSEGGGGVFIWFGGNENQLAVEGRFISRESDQKCGSPRLPTSYLHQGFPTARYLPRVFGNSSACTKGRTEKNRGDGTTCAHLERGSRSSAGNLADLASSQGCSCGGEAFDLHMQPWRPQVPQRTCSDHYYSQLLDMHHEHAINLSVALIRNVLHSHIQSDSPVCQSHLHCTMLAVADIPPAALFARVFADVSVNQSQSTAAETSTSQISQEDDARNTRHRLCALYSADHKLHSSATCPLSRTRRLGCAVTEFRVAQPNMNVAIGQRESVHFYIPSSFGNWGRRIIDWSIFEPILTVSIARAAGICWSHPPTHPRLPTGLGDVFPTLPPQTQMDVTQDLQCNHSKQSTCSSRHKHHSLCKQMALRQNPGCRSNPSRSFVSNSIVQTNTNGRFTSYSRLNSSENKPVGPLVFVRGNMNTEDPCYFQDDNARCHVSRATVQWYADNNVRRLDWPAQNPDLSPIEHLWDELDRRVRARQARPKSIAQLMEWLQEEWRRISVDVLQTLVESMPDRVAAVIAARVNDLHTGFCRSLNCWFCRMTQSAMAVSRRVVNPNLALSLSLRQPRASPSITSPLRVHAPHKYTLPLKAKFSLRSRGRILTALAGQGPYELAVGTSISGFFILVHLRRLAGFELQSTILVSHQGELGSIPVQAFQLGEKYIDITTVATDVSVNFASALTGGDLIIQVNRLHTYYNCDYDYVYYVYYSYDMNDCCDYDYVYYNYDMNDCCDYDYVYYSYDMNDCCDYDYVYYNYVMNDCCDYDYVYYSYDVNDCCDYDYVYYSYDMNDCCDYDYVYYSYYMNDCCDYDYVYYSYDMNDCCDYVYYSYDMNDCCDYDYVYYSYDMNDCCDYDYVYYSYYMNDCCDYDYVYYSYYMNDCCDYDYVYYSYDMNDCCDYDYVYYSYDMNDCCDYDHVYYSYDMNDCCDYDYYSYDMNDCCGYDYVYYSYDMNDCSDYDHVYYSYDMNDCCDYDYYSYDMNDCCDYDYYSYDMNDCCGYNYVYYSYDMNDCCDYDYVYYSYEMNDCCDYDYVYCSYEMNDCCDYDYVYYSYDMNDCCDYDYVYYSYDMNDSCDYY